MSFRDIDQLRILASRHTLPAALASAMVDDVIAAQDWELAADLLRCPVGPDVDGKLREVEAPQVRAAWLARDRPADELLEVLRHESRSDVFAILLDAGPPSSLVASRIVELRNPKLAEAIVVYVSTDNLEFDPSWKQPLLEALAKECRWEWFERPGRSAAMTNRTGFIESPEDFMEYATLSPRHGPNAAVLADVLSTIVYRRAFIRGEDLAGRVESCIDLWVECVLDSDFSDARWDISAGGTVLRASRELRSYGDTSAVEEKLLEWSGLGHEDRAQFEDMYLPLDRSPSTSAAASRFSTYLDEGRGVLAARAAVVDNMVIGSGEDLRTVVASDLPKQHLTGLIVASARAGHYDAVGALFTTSNGWAGPDSPVVSALVELDADGLLTPVLDAARTASYINRQASSRVFSWCELATALPHTVSQFPAGCWLYVLSRLAAHSQCSTLAAELASLAAAELGDFPLSWILLDRLAEHEPSRPFSELLEVVKTLADD